jgi:hypothetical protein
MIQDYLRAGYPALLVRTHEPERFIMSATLNGGNNGRTAFTWDVVRGWRPLEEGHEWQECDPYDLPNLAARGTDRAVWFLRNYHFWLNEPAVIQAIQNNLPLYKTKGITLVIVSPDAQAPGGAGAGGGGAGLSPAHPGGAEDHPGWPGGKHRHRTGGRGRGLGCGPGAHLGRGENAMALALVRQKKFDPHTICTLKAQMVEKSAALQFSQFTETFATLGGLENLKEWTEPVQEPAARAALPGHPAFGGARHWQKPLRQGPGQ